MLKNRMETGGKKQKFWFGEGDVLVYDDKHGTIAYGIVTKIGDGAKVDWKMPVGKIYSLPESFDFVFQFDVYNRSSYNSQTLQYTLIKHVFLKKNKKKPKVKVGDMVVTAIEDTTRPYYYPALKEEKTGLVVGLGVEGYYANVYLQQDMYYVWRSISDLRKL